MNYFMILYLLGLIFLIQSGCLLLPVTVGLFYGEKEWKVYALVSAVSLVLGLLLALRKPKKNVFYAKEGFVTVALSWIVLSLCGAVPFRLTGEIPRYIDAVFETASGFTTTGASILTNVEALSQTSLFWRSFTHWIGGMGVLVLLLAVVPLAGGHTMQLMRAESPGPSVGKFVPKVRQTAFILYSIYFAMTILEIVFLLAGGMPWFDSICTAFGTAGTGGFSIKNSSMGFYQSNYLQAVVTVFMILFAVNFSVYYLLLSKRFRQALKNEELLCFLGIIAVSVLCITLNIKDEFYGGNFYDAFHHSAFSVASIISTTGYGTADFAKWPQLSQYILLILMFVGACAGSTGGGLKVSRLVLLFKSSVREISKILHPRSVRAVKLDGKRVDSAVVKNTASFFVISMIVYVGSVFIVSFDGFDMTTSLTAVAATMNNIGPGLSLVGPTGNYSSFSNLSKIVMIFDMLAGRLEYFPMIVLFSPAMWKDGFFALRRKLSFKKN